MDVGHGVGSFSFFSTDLHQLSVNGPAYDLPTCMSKFLHLGMSLSEVVHATTARPARILDIERDVGSLRPGSCAGVALFQLKQGRFPLYDVQGSMHVAERLLVNTVTMIGGRINERVPPGPPAPWAEDPVWPESMQQFTMQQARLRSLGHNPEALSAAADANTASDSNKACLP
jgi:dihydroorotase